MSILSVKDLRKSYSRGLLLRKTEILKGLSFSVGAGTVTGFLGANGAGKTTTMRCMLGLDFADSGEIQFFGKPLSTDSLRKVGFLPEHPYFYEHLTGREFLEFYAKLSGPWKRAILLERIDQLLKRVDLTFAKDRPIRNYSKGMRQKIGIAQALIHDPELVILDEPMSGLDPDGRLALAEIILETAKRGPAVFFTSHLLHDTERLCQELIVIKDGVTIYQGGTEQLLERGGSSFEITILKNGEKWTRRTDSQSEMQKDVTHAINEGGTLLEVRRLRASLEEIFVAMALKGGRR